MKCGQCNGDSALLVKVRKDGWEGEICPLCLLDTKGAYRNGLTVCVDKESSKVSPERITVQGPALGSRDKSEDFFDLDPNEVVPFRGYGVWYPPSFAGFPASSSLPDVKGVPSPFPSMTISCSFTFDDIDTLVEKAKVKWGEDKLGLGGRKIFEHSFEQDLIREQESREQPMLDEEGRREYARAEARLDELTEEAREKLKKADMDFVMDFAWDGPRLYHKGE